MKITNSFTSKIIILIALLSVFGFQSYAQDVNSYKRDAEKGDKFAQYNLALCYESGKNIAKDINKAAYWYKKSADQGLPEAQYNLALCYLYGEGVKKSYDDARKYINMVIANPKATDSLKKEAKEVLSNIEDEEMLENYLFYGIFP